MTLKRAGVTAGMCLVFAAFFTMAGQTGLHAQGQNESALRTRISQYPQQIGNYLDLARLYADQGRYDDAEHVLSQAIVALRQQKMAAVSPQSGQPQAPAPVRVGGSILEPKLLKKVPPVKPQIAEQAQVKGVVIVEATIGTDGRIADARVIKSIPLLDQAALDAVRQWVYQPTLLNGVPVPVRMNVTIVFD